MFKKNITFTTIQHGARLTLGLSLNQYAVADIVYHLSKNPNNKKGGWCYMSKKSIGDLLGLSKQSVHKIINYLISCGLVERNEKGFLRTTHKWFASVVVGDIDSHNTLPPVNEVSFGESTRITRNGEASLHNKDINRERNTRFSVEKQLPFSVKCKEEELEVLQFFADIYKSLYLTRPVFGVKEVSCIKSALKHLSVSEAKQLVEEWFDSPKVREENRPIINLAFSNGNISRWKALFS